MASATDKGLPYPEAADQISAGANAIRSLAWAIGGYVQYGSATIAISKADTWVNVPITFDTAYAATPAITYARIGQNVQTGQLEVFDRTATGFTVRGRRTSGTSNIVVNWQATGPLPTDEQ